MLAGGTAITSQPRLPGAHRQLQQQDWPLEFLLKVSHSKKAQACHETVATSRKHHSLGQDAGHWCGKAPSQAVADSGLPFPALLPLLHLPWGTPLLPLGCRQTQAAQTSAAWLSPHGSDFQICTSNSHQPWKPIRKSVKCRRLQGSFLLSAWPGTDHYGL